MSFSPNSKMLAADDKNGVVYLWTLHGSPGATTVSGPGSVTPPGGPNVNAVAFSPRGTILALGGNDGQTYLFDTATGSTTRTLGTPDNSAVTSVAFSSGGALLAASKMDGMTYVWNLDTRSRISLADPDGSIIESVAFSPNGKWLATGDVEGHTYLWNLAAKKDPDQAGQGPDQPDERQRPHGRERGLFGGVRPAQQHARYHRHERLHLPVAGALTLAIWAPGGPHLLRMS